MGYISGTPDPKNGKTLECIERTEKIDSWKDWLKYKIDESQKYNDMRVPYCILYLLYIGGRGGQWVGYSLDNAGQAI